MHRGAFTRKPLAAVLREKPLAGAFGNSLAPQKSRLFPTKFLFHELFSKNIRNIFLKQVPIQKLSSPHCDEMEGREIRRSRRGASALKFGSAGSPRVACPTSVPERLELYGEARPKPPTLRRRAPINTKNPSGGWGGAFWLESGSLISVSKTIFPPPAVLRVPKIGKKRRFDTFFGQFSAFRFNVLCGSNAKTQKML